MLRNLRFAKDDSNLIWIKGQGCAVKINEQSFVQAYELTDFFPKGYTPMYVCSNTDGSAVYGYSSSSRNSVLSVNKQEIINRVTSNLLRKFEIQSADKWVGMDVTLKDECLVYFASSRVNYREKDGSVSLNVVFKAEALGNFYSGMYEHKFTTIFEQEVLRRAHKVRRIKGINVFVVSCFNSIAILNVDIEAKKFFLVKVYENIYTSFIVDVVMVMDMIVPVPRADSPENLKYIDFNAQLRRMMGDDERGQEIMLLINSNLPKEIASIYV